MGSLVLYKSENHLPMTHIHMKTQNRMTKLPNSNNEHRSTKYDNFSPSYRKTQKENLNPPVLASRAESQNDAFLFRAAAFC
jgi:hypothetical protein